jgi:CysZ protein
VKLGEQLFLAYRSYGEAFRTLDKKRLWSILVLPSILSLLIAVGVGALAWTTSDDILQYVNGKFLVREFNSAVGKLFHIIATLAIRGLTFFIYLKLYRYLILILLSPIFVNISNVFHRLASGEDHKMNVWAYCFCSFRGIKFAFRNFGLEILVTTLLTLLAVIVFWIFPLIPILIFIAESYFFSMVLMDYAFEMGGVSMKDSIKKTRSMPGIPVANGLIFNFILLIPIIGVIAGPVIAFIAAQESVNALKK